MKPHYHAASSVRLHGGTIEDYLPIHNLLDSSKGTIADNRHRTLTHNSWFIFTVIEAVFGSVQTNSSGRKYSPREIAEQHVKEDFNKSFIPTPQDYLENTPLEPWMIDGKGKPPPSFRKLYKPLVIRKIIKNV